MPILSKLFGSSKKVEQESRFAAAQAALDNHNFDEAFQVLESLATEGHSEAQVWLALYYQRVRNDLANSNKWFRLAAEQGHKTALSSLGCRLLYGKGCEPDWEQAMKFLYSAASKGDGDAMHTIGCCFVNGIGGVGRDFTEAVKWFRKAAEKGHVPSQYNMAISYKQGTGVPQDERQATYWWEKAAEQGLPIAQYNTAISYRDGLGVQQDSSRAQYWFEQAAKNGFTG
jgi:TPR repeat protein